MTGPAMVVVLIPVLDEARNIGGVVRGVHAVLERAGEPCHLLVIDDGSRDGTGTVLRELATAHPLSVETFAENRGIGPVLRVGLPAALARSGDDGVVVVMEGDGSNDPAVLPAMLHRVRDGADVVIASRFTAGAGMPGFPLLRRLLSWSLLCLLHGAGMSRAVTDGSIFYRAYRGAALRRALEVGARRTTPSPGFAANTELLLDLLDLGARVAEVPLTYRYDVKRSGSKIRVGPETRDQLKLVARVWRRSHAS